MVHGTSATAPDLVALAATIKAWGRDIGFQAVGIADADLGAAESGLAAWHAAGFHGEMGYMRRHGARRARPRDLVPGTVRVISARMDYLPEAADGPATLADGAKAFVSRYALGRDYHKVLRARLQKLADRIENEIGAQFGYRAQFAYPHSFTHGICCICKRIVNLQSEHFAIGWAAYHFSDDFSVSGFVCNVCNKKYYLLDTQTGYAELSELAERYGIIIG